MMDNLPLVEDIWRFCIIPNLTPIDCQSLRKTCIELNKLIPYKKLKFNNFDEPTFEFIHIEIYKNQWTVDTPAIVAKFGDLKSLKYLHENGCPWSFATHTNAARYGHLKCLKYAEENKCDHKSMLHRYVDLDLEKSKYKSSIIEAAKGDHLDVLMYLYPIYIQDRENGIDDIYDAELIAIAYGSFRWSVYNIDKYTDKIQILIAARYGRFEIFKYIHEKGVKWDNNIYAELFTPLDYHDGIFEAEDILTSEDGRFEIFKYIYEIEHQWLPTKLYLDTYVTYRFVAYAFDNNCPFRYELATFLDKDDFNRLLDHGYIFPKNGTHV
jgi:hypothetical protein